MNESQMKAIGRKCAMNEMQRSIRHELLEASDELIDDAVQYADPMVLRGLIYQLTGDPEIADTEVTMVARSTIPMPAPANPEVAELLRRKAAEFLKSYRDAGGGPVGPGPEERLHDSIRLTWSQPIEDEHIQMYVEELALNPWARSLDWSDGTAPTAREGFSVTVIGSGMGGLNAALQLKRAGIPFTVIEKNSGVGGTWHENRYPGARVDTPSRSYTHIFGVDFGYPNPYCPQSENQRYFDWVADNFDLRRHIQFNTEVHSLTWNEDEAMWDVHITGPDGERTIRSNAVITAVGFLNRPNIGTVEGHETFKGPSWHTSRWPDAADLRGKRVAVIGTGATGYQMIPELALEAKHVTVFQRTPQWVTPSLGYRSPFPAQVGWLDRNLPYYTNFMRLRTAIGGDFSHVTEIDPDFKDPHSRSLANAQQRERAMDFLKSKLGNSNLVEVMTPPHPYFSARPIIVDPDYSILDAIQRDNVTLVTGGIDRVNATGIRDKEGVQHDVDVIVYATGFHATEYLYPMKIIGRDGRSIEDYWAEGGARAYRCCMVPGFPNMWSIYGPNSNGALTVASFHEMVTLYALQCIEKLIIENKRAVDVTEEAYWRFAEQMDEANRRKVWSDPRAQNYYWTRHNRSAVMNPFSGTHMWSLLREVEFGDLNVS
jgi:4-hydroxyacetophenone monooxygenase